MDSNVWYAAAAKVPRLVMHAKVFRVETATVVVGDDPDRADGFPLDVEGDQQAFLEKRRDFAEVGEITFGMRK